jgi:hypothetical protein
MSKEAKVQNTPLLLLTRLISFVQIREQAAYAKHQALLAAEKE